MEKTAREVLQNYPVVNKRRWQVDAIIRLVMDEIDDLVPQEAKHGIYDRLQHLMELNGFHIMTDTDRAALGLEPLDSQGWAMTDRMKERARRDAAMFEMMQAIVVKRTTA